jgi:hypothetical protein
MKRWLDPKMLAVAALLMAAQQGIKLSKIEWTTADLGASLLVVLLGGLFWGLVLTALRNLLNRK